MLMEVVVRVIDADSLVGTRLAADPRSANLQPGDEICATMAHGMSDVLNVKRAVDAFNSDRPRLSMLTTIC